MSRSPSKLVFFLSWKIGFCFPKIALLREFFLSWNRSYWVKQKNLYQTKNTLNMPWWQSASKKLLKNWNIWDLAGFFLVKPFFFLSFRDPFLRFKACLHFRSHYKILDFLGLIRYRVWLISRKKSLRRVIILAQDQLPENKLMLIENLSFKIL